jgi:hypothetical protein
MSSHDSPPRDPASGRFLPGVSGNRKGRPPRRGLAQRAILSALKAPVMVEGADGRPRRMSKLAAAARHVADQGVAGDVRAGKLALDLALKVEDRTPAPPTAGPPTLGAGDETLLARLVDRVRRMAADEAAQRQEDLTAEIRRDI